MAGEQWQSGVIRRQLNRRRLLATAGAGATALAVACGNRRGNGGGPPAKQQTGAGRAAKQPKRGGNLNYAGGILGSFDTQGRSFDPHIQTQYGARSYTLFYERLVAYNLVTYNVSRSSRRNGSSPHRPSTSFTCSRTSNGRIKLPSTAEQ